MYRLGEEENGVDGLLGGQVVDSLCRVLGHPRLLDEVHHLGLGADWARDVYEMMDDVYTSSDDVDTS